MDRARALRRLVRRARRRGAGGHGDDGREAVRPLARDQPHDDWFELCTVVLTDLGDGRTEMRFEQRGRMSLDEYERAAKGWGTFFDVVADRLAA